MNSEEIIALTRDCETTQIPSGNVLLLKAGTPVRITQSLGGSYTVMTEEGFMVRIAAKDLDALGKEPAQTPSQSQEGTVDAASLEKMIWEQLKTCYDPEIPVNIADLGLIYSCKIFPLAEGGGYRVQIQMTLTAPGCGMGQVLQSDVRAKLLRLPGVKEAQVDLVWEPLWDRSMMSEAAKLQLGIF